MVFGSNPFHSSLYNVGILLVFLVHVVVTMGDWLLNPLLFFGAPSLVLPLIFHP